MSKARFYSAYISSWRDGHPTMRIELEIGGKRIELSDLPCSNELIKELTATFKRYLPKPEDI